MEKWSIKDNGGRVGGEVGIVSNKSKWFIAENVLPKHAKIIVDLFNTAQLKNKEKKSNSTLSPNNTERDEICSWCNRDSGKSLHEYLIIGYEYCPRCGRKLSPVS